MSVSRSCRYPPPLQHSRVPRVALEVPDLHSPEAIPSPDHVALRERHALRSAPLLQSPLRISRHHVDVVARGLLHHRDVSPAHSGTLSRRRTRLADFCRDLEREVVAASEAASEAEAASAAAAEASEAAAAAA